MTSALAWLSQIMESLMSFVPRMIVIRSTHRGVKFQRGWREKEVTPGLCFYWPVVTDLEVWPVARQTKNLPIQSLVTKDGKRVIIGGVVVYAITDIIAALAKNWDLNDTISDITMCAITHVITKHNYQYLQENLTESIQQELTKETRRKLKPYGLRVYRAAITDFSPAVVIRTIGGNATVIGGNVE